MKTDEAPLHDKQQHKGLSGSAPEFIAEHTVAQGETLSHIALKYYDSAEREKWMAIYEANQAVIGDNPSVIRPGQVLKIPKLG